jgi:hypothetical protein
MSDLAPTVRTLAQRNHALILRGMADVTQRRVAELIGISESVLSEFKDKHLERAAAVIAACGYRITPCTDQSYPEAYIAALKTLAAVGLEGEPRNVEDGP